MKKLSVILPAYNEASRISNTLQAIDAFLSKQSFDYEILVVNDGSHDATARVVTESESRIKNLRLIDNTENHGKGWVVKQGMLAATGDIRLFMDADNSTTIDQVVTLLPYFDQGYDVVVGSRRVVGAKISVKQSPLRDFLGGAFRLIVHTIVPVGVIDTQCGYKAFTAQAAQTVFSQQRIYRWAFDVEILAIAVLKGLKIKEAPIVWIDDAQTHVKLSGMINMLLEVLEARWNLWSGKYNA